ncbi:MAG: hypothetical protein WAM28_05910 [Chlamydiales bacterium]
MVVKKDATVVALKAHQIIFENDFLRILESKLESEQLVPFHTHPLDSIILTIQGSKFRCNDGSNLVEEDWPPMAEKSEGSFHAYSYQNIGPAEFLALVFEFKK